MKKLCFVLALCAMFLLVGCGNGSKDSADTGDTDTSDTADTTDTAAADTGDTNDSAADTGDSTADTGDHSDTGDHGDSSADTGDSSADTGDSSTDTGDSSTDTGDSSADTGDPGPVTGDTRTANCENLPANAQWNTATSIVQTWNGSTWSPSTSGSYNTTASTTECRYKCNSTHYWYNSECVNPCDYDPCEEVANSTKVCTATAWNDYSCGCSEGYFWNGSECRLPECSKDSGTPCKDSSSGLTWSARASSTMTWSNTGTYCDNLTEGGYSDWHLPTIDELKTLLIANRVTSNCQISETNGCLSSSCWSCSTCTQTGTQSSSGTSCSSWGSSYSDGRYSKFGETGYFWSSSTKSDSTDSAWGVSFNRGGVDGSYKTNYNNVRCVR